MNYYEHHIGDYAAATAHLSWDEDAAYTRLLRAYYHHERGIPEGQQYRIARASTPGQRRAVDAVLAEFFRIVDGHYTQKRAEQEIARFQDKQRKAKASAEARWANSGRNANALPDAMRTDMRTHSEGNALQSPVSSLQTPEEKENPPPLADPPQKPASKASKRCPPNFTPDASHQAIATERRISFDTELDAFRDHTFATARSDWPATFRNWLRKAQPSKAQGGSVLSFRERDEAAARAAHARWTGSTPADDPNTLDMEETHARLAIDR